MRLWIDFETRSDTDLKDSGLDRYAHDPSTSVLMLAYVFDDGQVDLWEPHKGPMPPCLSNALLDPSVQLCAWNYNFERDILEFVLGIPTAQTRWYDPSVLCAYMSLPIGLDRAADALGVTAKIKLIAMGPKGGVHKGGTKMFCAPFNTSKKLQKAGAPPKYFKDWNSHPKEWEEFCEYCRGDVRSEREVNRSEERRV